MKNIHITTAVLVLSALVSGCSGNSLREGTWKLSFEAVSYTHLTLPTKA